MYLTSKAGWPEELSISIGTLEARSGLERRSVYRTRIVLCDEGLIDFREQSGNRSALYKIISQAGLQYKNAPQIDTQDGECGTNMHHKVSHSKSERCKNVPQTVTQTDTQDGDCGTDLHHKMSHTEGVQYKNALQSDTQDGACGTNMHRKVSHTEDLQYKNVPQSVTQTEPLDDEMPGKDVSNSDLPKTDDECRDLSQPENTPYISIYKERNKKDIGGIRGKKKNAGFDLSFIGDEVWEALIESWLDYKRSRSENYKSELSVKKFHTMLRNYSRGDPGLARQIIDKSIANNWAGIFELAPDDGKPRNQSAGVAARPATGQRIGQIKQPEDDERRQKLLAKFDSKK